MKRIWLALCLVVLMNCLSALDDTGAALWGVRVANQP